MYVCTVHTDCNYLFLNLECVHSAPVEHGMRFRSRLFGWNEKVQSGVRLYGKLLICRDIYLGNGSQKGENVCFSPNWKGVGGLHW